MSINILLTGRPGTGKTTVIKKFIRMCPLSAGGFFTGEIRERGVRAGFSIEAAGTWDREDRDNSEQKNRAVMAHVNSRSPYRVGRYGVNISAIEEVGVSALRQGMERAKIIIIDEIGRMELHSSLFQKEVINVLDSRLPVLGVIQIKRNPFLDAIRKRDDVTVIQVTADNREKLPERLFDIFGIEA